MRHNYRKKNLLNLHGTVGRLMICTQLQSLSLHFSVENYDLGLISFENQNL
jgi:hypothetical protein